MRDLIDYTRFFDAYKEAEIVKRLDVEELVGYRSYAQKREKEVKSRLDMLQDDNDRKDVLIKDQAAEIARLKGELQVRSNDLELAIEDLKTCTNREWKKHRSVCMEIGGVYIDFNHQEEVGLTMDRSSKYGPEALGMTGVGLKIGNVYPFEILSVHPDARTSDGLPAILHEGDKVVAIEEVSLEHLNKADVNGLIVGPVDTEVYIKIIRGFTATYYYYYFLLLATTCYYYLLLLATTFYYLLLLATTSTTCYYLLLLATTCYYRYYASTTTTTSKSSEVCKWASYD